MNTWENTTAHEAALVRVGPQEAVLRGLMQDRVRAVVCWIDLRSPAYCARVGPWTYEQERNDVETLAGWACHDALSLQEAAVFLDFFVFDAGTVADTLGEVEPGMHELTWLS